MWFKLVLGNTEESPYKSLIVAKIIITIIVVTEITIV